jgi:hypothetical protein
MKSLIKQLLREELLKEENLEEGYFKSFLAGLLMTYGLSWGQIKPEYKTKIDSIQKLENLSKQEKREEIEKIVKINRDEIKQNIQKAQSSQKPMYGTPEQRADALEKQKENRSNIFKNFVKSAYYAEGCVEEVSDEEYASGCKSGDNEGEPYINGTSNDLPDYVYRELNNGTKIKINLNKYRKILKKRGKAEDAPVDGLMDPNFKATSCGISKAAAKQDKKDFKKK